MLQKIRNNMFYIVTPIYWIVLVALYPIAVPQYCSEATFLLGWLLFVLIASLIIRSILNLLERRS